MRSIIHVDMDAFYASVEQRDHPSYRGQPVIVGADPQGGKGRGVVSAASYEARAFGIHSAMPISHAYRRCPKGVFVPVRMERYQEVSTRIFDIFHRYTDLVEPLSLDEAFLDVTGSRRLFGGAEIIGRRIQEKIWREERLQASVGVASNKFIAKVASDLKKPKGFVVVPPEEVARFLKDLPVHWIWGVGAKTTERLHRLGYVNIGDIARQNQQTFRVLFGVLGTRLWQLANGLDDRPVVADEPAKSIGAESTFSQDTGDGAIIRQTLLALADRIAQRLRAERTAAKTVTLKYRDDTFQTTTRSMAIDECVDQTTGLYRAALQLLSRVPDKKRKVRLLGLSASALISVHMPQQLSLFEDQRVRNIQLSEAIDKIRQQFGDEAVRPASLLERPKRD